MGTPARDANFNVIGHFPGAFSNCCGAGFATDIKAFNKYNKGLMLSVNLPVEEIQKHAEWEVVNLKLGEDVVNLKFSAVADDASPTVGFLKITP